MSYVYIAAFGRSGSTLLASMLAENLGYLSVGEFFPGIIFREPDYLCSCGEKVSRCEFYRKIMYLLTTEERNIIQEADRLINQDLSFRTKLAIYPTFNRFLRFGQEKAFMPSILRRYTSVVRKLVNSLLDEYSMRVFIDASKQYYLLHCYLQTGFKDVKVLHLYRNPLGVYASRKRSRLENLEGFCNSYNRYFRFNENFRKYPEVSSCLAVDYNELVLNNTKVLKDILEFIGYYKGPKSKDQKVHIGGNEKRLIGGSLQLDMRWQEELTIKEIEYIKKNTCYTFH